MKYFDNHLNQLRSYINEIQNYEISYGYLLYWRYSFQKNEEGFNGSDDFSLFSGEKTDDEGGLVIEQAFAKKIKPSVKDKELYLEQYGNIKNLIKNGEMDFDKNSRNLAKCGGCVVSILCGHKTGNYGFFFFSIFRKHLNTKFVKFPFVKYFILV